ALRLGQASVGIATLVEFDGAPPLGVSQREQAHGVAPRPSREQGAAVRIRRQTSDHEFRRGVRDFQLFLSRQQAVGEGESMDDLVLAAADVERFAVGSEAEAVEGLLNRDATGNSRPFALDVEDHDLVLAITGVKHSQPTTTRMERQIDGEIAEWDLPS